MKGGLNSIKLYIPNYNLSNITNNDDFTLDVSTDFGAKLSNEGNITSIGKTSVEKIFKNYFIGINGNLCQTHPRGEYTSSTPPHGAHSSQTFCLIGVKEGLATVDSARTRDNLEQVTRLSLNARDLLKTIQHEEHS